MTTLRSLSQTPLSLIHHAFEDAFSEYQVAISMPEERLAKMMRTRSYDAELSLGYFVDDELAGFILTGFREMDGRRCAYDVATGVIKAFQRQGIGDMLLRAQLQNLRERGMDCFLLEVLENNPGAQKLYLKNGFRITRRFNCYQKALSPHAAQIQRVDETVRLATDIMALDESLYSGFQPSWQNSFASLKVALDSYRIVVLRESNLIVAYGIVHKERGSILQAGLHPQYRNATMLEYLLQQLATLTAADKLVFLNVEEGSFTDHCLPQYGFAPDTAQFEMCWQAASQDK